MRTALLTFTCATLAFAGLPVAAQTGSNSFRGIYEVSFNGKPTVLSVGQNSQGLCLSINSAAQLAARSQPFTVSPTGGFSFSFLGSTVSGTFTSSAVSGSIGGSAFNGSRAVVKNVDGGNTGTYSGWYWNTVNKNIDQITWIIAPSGNAYVQIGSTSAVDGGFGTTNATNGFSFASVLDNFLYVGTATLTNGVLKGNYPLDSSNTAYFQMTRENVTYHLINISTRGFVGTGSSVMIAGFVIRGGAKRVIIRALGPTLSGFGVVGALADPTLEVLKDGATLTTNDNWRTHPTNSEVQAASLAPANEVESAVAVTLEPGSYTAIVRGAGGATGVALVEVYEMD